jgi:ribosome-associated heat shock protein Hsp15
VTKAHYQVRPGQVLTFVQGNHIRIVRVSGIPERRGPALEAQLFYDDLDPPGVDNFVPATLV